MRVPFEPEVLVAGVAAGLRAARLRANEALLRSLVDNIPGALYRGACDRDWTMYWLSDEVETITGYPASDFVDNSVRTFARVIHPDDRDYVERSVAQAVDARRPFNLEYRILRRDDEVRWVLECWARMVVVDRCRRAGVWVLGCWRARVDDVSKSRRLELAEPAARRALRGP